LRLADLRISKKKAKKEFIPSSEWVPKKQFGKKSQCAALKTVIF